VAAFLLDMFDRIRVTDDQISNSFELKLTQEEIGDSVGLTSVHVNRMIRQMEQEGLISRSNGRVTLLDLARLEDIGHYTNRLKDMNLDWLPVS
jgi:CRP/FNR family transcriptional regulator, anaerobic regulatory protein